MSFSLSSLCTDAFFAILLLLLMRLLGSRASRLGRFGINALLFCSILLLIRLLLPFEWVFTKTVPLYVLYPEITNFLNRNIIRFSFLDLPLFQFLFATSCVVSTIKISRLFYCQNKYFKYLNTLPLTASCSYTNSFGRVRKVRCVVDPASTNAFAVGLIQQQIVLPDMVLSSREKRFVFDHEISHIISGDIWLKFFAKILCSIYWWIPFINTLQKQISAATEFRADQSVIESLDKNGKLDYLECLLKVAKNNRQKDLPLAASFTTAQSASLKERFHIILSSQPHKVMYSIFTILLALIIALSSFVVFEPFAISDSVQSESFTIIESESFLVRRENCGFALYLDGIFAGGFDVIPTDFENLPIYDTVEEAGRRNGF